MNAIELSHAVLKNIKENLFWAFFYNVIGIPIAAGVFYPVFGWLLDPMFGLSLIHIFTRGNDCMGIGKLCLFRKLCN